MSFGKLLFLIARWPINAPIVRFGFSHLSWLIPVQKIQNTSKVISFHHPKPTWDTHILFVPKCDIPTFLDINDTTVSNIIDIFHLANEFVKESNRDNSYILQINGGKYQDIGQTHFHLMSGEQIVVSVPKNLQGTQILETKFYRVFNHPNPQRDVHILLIPKLTKPDQVIDKYFILDLRKIVDKITSQHKLAGYSLLWYLGRNDEYSCHLVT